MEQFNLFSGAEPAPQKTARSRKLGDNEFAVYFNTKSKTYYIRFNAAVSGDILRHGFKVCAPVFNNLTGAIYLVFAPDTDERFKSGFLLSKNGDSPIVYVFARQFVEWLLEHSGRNVEDMSEAWSITGNVSIQPEIAVHEIRKPH